jgi:uncharacterized iron-regulated protein
MDKPVPDPRRLAYADWQRRERAGDLRALLGLLLLAWLVFLAVPVAAEPGAKPVAGAAGLTPVPEAAQRAPAPGQLLLLGEVHDHAGGHAWRLARLDAWLAEGARPALVMEMLDHEAQPRIDALRARTPAPSAAELVAAVGGRGWRWEFYEPFVERALRFGLPLVAANVGREPARALMKDGLAAHGYDAAVPPEVLQGLAEAIEASHCGMVDAALSRRMALAQVARDQQMARALASHAARGAVLLAGNGHVRRDLGAPRWLPPDLAAGARVIGVLEEGHSTPAAAFDGTVLLPREPRPDPCESMRRPPQNSSDQKIAPTSAKDRATP